MKTIEERALAYSEQVFNDTPFDVFNGKVCVWQEDKDICEVAGQAYIDGALEQRKIDIKRACDEFERFLNIKLSSPLEISKGEIQNNMKFWVEDFRKAIEERL